MNRLDQFFSPPDWGSLVAELKGKPWHIQQREIIALAKALPDCPSEWQQPANRVPGCEVPVYVIYQEERRPMPWCAWSPSRILCGQLRLLQAYARYLGTKARTPDDILAAFDVLGIRNRLPDSRRHGLVSVLSEVLDKGI